MEKNKTRGGIMKKIVLASVLILLFAGFASAETLTKSGFEQVDIDKYDMKVTKENYNSIFMSFAKKITYYTYEQDKENFVEVKKEAIVKYNYIDYLRCMMQRIKGYKDCKGKVNQALELKVQKIIDNEKVILTSLQASIKP
jgi:hypothetical protein